MKKFTNILVGVEIDRHGALAENARPAIEQACWLAEQQGAQVTLAHVIDAPDAEDESSRTGKALAERKQKVRLVLDSLVGEYPGANANTAILFGRGWQALIEAVTQKHYDLVVVGTRKTSIIGRALFGSTGNRLLRYCPCPVWAIKPGDKLRYTNIMVAHDLTEVGSSALQIASTMATLHQASLHVVHIIEHKEQDDFLGMIDQDELKRREQEQHEAVSADCRQLGHDNAHIVVRSGNPHTEILNYVNHHGIDMLCMGTVARSGLSGVVTGNTAENVLPWVDCSLITTKPASFKGHKH